MTTSSLTAVPSGVRFVPLTDREIRILGEFLIDGATNAVVGTRSYLAEETVKTYFRHILRKTGTDNRAALAIAVLTEEVFIIDSKGQHVRF